MNKAVLFLNLLLCLMPAILPAKAQELLIKAKNKPLSEVLVNITEEISFDSKNVAGYNITTERKFNSIYDALTYLLKDTGLKFKKVNGVFVIYKPVKKIQAEKKVYYYRGIAQDTENNMPLPYASITGENIQTICNEKGEFFFSSKYKMVRVKFGYVGTEPKDTAIYHGIHTIKLSAGNVLKDMVIYSGKEGLLMQYQTQDGHILIHNRMMQELPGGSDNSFWQTLRMMPGVLASGEENENIITRGEHYGGTSIILDGMRIIKAGNFYKNIGTVNPLIINDMELQKSNINQDMPDAVSGIVNIHSKWGNTEKTEIHGNISNLTAGMYANTHAGKRIGFSAAYRQTFYNLYDNSIFNPVNQKIKNNSSKQDSGHGKGISSSDKNKAYNNSMILKSRQGTSSIKNNGANKTQKILTNYELIPEHEYNDLNININADITKNGKHKLFFALYANNEPFNYTIIADSTDYNGEITDRQLAFSTRYSAMWNSENNTEISYSNSNLRHKESHTSIPKNKIALSKENAFNNNIHISDLKIFHNINIKNNRFISGIKYTEIKTEGNIVNSVKYITGSFKYRYINKKINAGLGLNINMPDSGNINILPRIYIGYNINKKIIATVSSGIFRQYITKNYRDNRQILAISNKTKAKHFNLNITYSGEHLISGLNFYMKDMDNIQRYLIKGSEFFGKYEYRHGYLTSNYSVTDIENDIWHEWKTAGAIRLHRFSFSAEYVMGRGIEQTGNYDRADIAAYYLQKISFGHLRFGISALNIFNTKNSQFNDLIITDNDNTLKSVYYKAIPFSLLASCGFFF